MAAKRQETITQLGMTDLDQVDEVVSKPAQKDEIPFDVISQRRSGGRRRGGGSPLQSTHASRTADKYE